MYSHFIFSIFDQKYHFLNSLDWISNKMTSNYIGRTPLDDRSIVLDTNRKS